MILLLQLDDSPPLRFEVTDTEVQTWPGSNRTDMVTRRRRARVWRHKRGRSAIAQSEPMARLMLDLA